MFYVLIFVRVKQSKAIHNELKTYFIASAKLEE